MPKPKVPALPNSLSFEQLWEALVSKLIEAAQERLPSKQAVAGSSPVSRSSFKERKQLEDFNENQGVGSLV